MTQFNYLTEQGAIEFDADAGTYSADLEAFPGAIRDLTAEYLEMEATGDYERAGAFLEEYGRMSDRMAATLEELESVPVDIRPSFAVKGWMGGW